MKWKGSYGAAKRRARVSDLCLVPKSKCNVTLAILVREVRCSSIYTTPPEWPLCGLNRVSLSHNTLRPLLKFKLRVSRLDDISGETSTP